MHAGVNHQSRISSENRRFYWRALAVETAAIKRNPPDVFQIEIDYISGDGVQEAIEWLPQRELKLSDDTDDFVNSCPVEQTSRSVYEQTDVLVKFDISWQRQFHCSSEFHFITLVIEQGFAHLKC